jgi:hypothetical protein
MATLVVKDALAVDHQVLEVTDLRPVDGRMICFVQHTG